ncbi:LysE family translocator [Pyxidicoccus fallax]|uniref:LysE family translocator n=1 Tax=Pyxidicoccus fallax TaxID=394095 RepID=A0A848LFS3_9BACT|nr:LysE family translocator [Pyxidicoccus fallax]NMO15211.1 LysE family translocator [Pyxidicoccus fallax]NPC76910.1 LysE family translocator [Pyxidicoccus fallax]
MSLSLSMAAFALAASISPGPVNVVALSAGARHGLRASMRHVSGATVGFTLLLLAIGLGLHGAFLAWPWLASVLRLTGVVYLLYLAWKLWSDDGRLGGASEDTRPGYWSGALMQWLNPKAWLACVAGMGAFVAGGELAVIGRFAAIYFAVCYVSIACWAAAGSSIRHWVDNPTRLRRFNRAMAVLLAGCALYLLAW